MVKSRHVALGAAGFFLVWAGIFATAYAQSPLYTSNQNQYFLHGLAQAGFGNLNADWLANTLDPTPLFSGLVEFTYRLFDLPGIFYLYYALLMGVYLYSFLGIARAICLLPSGNREEFVAYQPMAEGGRSSNFSSTPRIFGRLPLETLIFLALFITIHSAGLRFGLARLLGPNWTYVLEDGVADQRMLGLVLQPSSFGVFLALSVLLFLQRRPYLAVLAAALAAAVHPTYLLSAAFLTLAYMATILMEERSFRKAAGIGAFAILAVAPIVAYVFNSFSGAGGSPGLAEQARSILVHFRIPHHSIAAQWFDATAVFKIGLILAALVLARRTRLFLILLIPFLSGLALSLIQVVLEDDFLALIFPWRISVLLVPLATTVLLGALVHRLTGLPSWREPRFRSLARTASILAIALAFLTGATRFALDLERKDAAPERSVQHYVLTHQQPGEQYLIPVKMQDFRLEAGAPAYIEFKSIPYREVDVLEWRRRYQLADQFYKVPGCEALEKLAAQEGITHLIIPADQPLACNFTPLVYADADYQLLAISQP